MHLFFALSITHFFSSAGADAGFAALIGLAILILLYFAHARETSTLRNQLAAATERIEQLERRLGGDAAPSIAEGQPLAAQASSPPPVAAPAVATGSGTASAGASAAPAAAAAAAGAAAAPAAAAPSAGASAAPVGAQSPSVAPR
ncbi:MAG: hypothetical protein ACTHQQ_05790, partial [Solirubrobacteraceae bacterium]